MINFKSKSEGSNIFSFAKIFLTNGAFLKTNMGFAAL